MVSSLNTLVASQHQSDLVRFAHDRRKLSSSRRSSSANLLGRAVSLRLAAPDEADLVERLSALDDAPALEGRVLLALIDDDAIAALSLHDGRVVANPFVWTDHAVALLRLRAEHLVGGRKRSRRRITLRPRFA